MKKIRNICFVLAIMVLICACGNHGIVNVKKQGTEFQYENASFYYPDKFSKDDEVPLYNKSRNDLNSTIAVLKNKKETIQLEVTEIVEENIESELIELFKLDLESLGYKSISGAKVTLESGDSCYELVVENGVIKAKYLIAYEHNQRYSLAYCAPIEVFDKNILKMDNYLYTFVIKEHGEQDHLH